MTPAAIENWEVGPRGIAILYAGLGFAWIVVTDLGVATVYGRDVLTELPRTLKGIVFVSLSAVVVFWLVRRSTRQLQATRADLERANRERAIYDRILRHNFRNELQVVDGNVELARTADDDEHDEYLERAEEGCEQLLDICHDAREFSALIDSDPDPVSVDLTAKLREAVAVVEEYPAATLRFDPPESADAIAVDAIDVAFRHAIENACEHAGERPNVDVTVRERADTVDVRVSDDGSGVPESERTALADGVERPLQHSSRLGLRIVQWLVDRSSGDLAFEGDDSTVRLSFPRTETHKVGSPAHWSEPR